MAVSIDSIATSQPDPASATVRLSQLRPGQDGELVGVDCRDARGRRLMEIGLVPGRTIRFVRRSPFRDPIVVQVGGGRYTLRLAEADLVSVVVSASTQAA